MLERQLRTETGDGMTKRQWHRWTAEEDNFLRRYYPDHGIAATLCAYNKMFNREAGRRSIEHRVFDLGLKLSEKRYREKQIENGRNWSKKERRDIGFINKDSGMIKTETGWTRLGKLLNVPKGYYAVHLNNDVTDNRPENIEIISMRMSAKMTKNSFWSTNSVITKTGLMCLELEDAIHEKGNIIFTGVQGTENTTETMDKK